MHTPEEERALAEMVILIRDHPLWAVWAPRDGAGWTAVRPAGSRPPAPDLPMIWVSGRTPDDLARMMEAADQRVSRRHWFRDGGGSGDCGA